MKTTLKFLRARTLPDGSCWVWTGAAQRGMLPFAKVNGKGFYVRRAIYEERKGPMPEGMRAGVSCGCALCVNPAHVVAVSKKAPIGPMTLTHKIRMTLALRKKSDLSQAAVDYIRTSDKRGYVLADELGIDPCRVYKIRGGKNWAPVGGPWAGLGARASA